jgi:hypothetical protein
VNNKQQNEAIIRFARTVPKGVSIGLCGGGTIVVSGFPEDSDAESVYYLSIFHDCKAVAIGNARTDLTVEVFTTKPNARSAASKLANVWGYKVLDSLGR